MAKFKRFVLFAAALSIIYLFGIPFLLHFNTAEITRWGPVNAVPEVLSAWARHHW